MAAASLMGVDRAPSPISEEGPDDGRAERDSVTSSLQAEAEGPGSLAENSRKEIVRLNVGGKGFVTTASTLQREPNSLLCRMCFGEGPAEVDENGVIYIDRDWRVFHHVLNFLRDGSVPIGLTRVSRMELLREARFYGLKALHIVAGGLQEPHHPSAIASPLQGHLMHDRAPGTAGHPSMAYDGQCPGHRQAHAGDHEANFRRARLEAAALGFLPEDRNTRQYVRLRYGHEYNGDWIVSSPRNLPGIDYELHGACLARTPVAAMNKMSRAGWRPCANPPQVPPVSRLYTKDWRINMYKDIALSLKSL